MASSSWDGVPECSGVDKELGSGWANHSAPPLAEVAQDLGGANMMLFWGCLERGGKRGRERGRLRIPALVAEFIRN